MYKTLRTLDYHKELIETLFKAKAGALSANVLAPLLIFYILKDFMPMQILSAWLFAQIIFFIFRLIVANKGLRILHVADQKSINRLLKYYLLLIFANAFFLGVSVIFALIYTDKLHVLILIAIMSAIAGGSMTTLAPVYHAVFIFIVVSLSTFIVSLVFLGATPTYYFVALLIFVYILVSLPSAFRIYTALNNSIKQKEEIKELNASLKQSVGKLQEKNKNFEYLLDTTMEAIIISDENHKIIDSNQSGAILFKVKDKSAFIGRRITEFVPNYELPKLQKALHRKYDEPREYDLMKNDGTFFPVLASGRDMIMNGEKARVSIILDLTQIKKQEQQMLAQSRLAQMGEMISMIAHQWRQPLGAISATAIDLKIKIELGTFDLQTKEGQDACNEYFLGQLDDIEHFVQNLTTTIDDFRNFYKPNKELVSVTLETVIAKALNIIKTSLDNDNVEIIYDYHSNEKLQLHDGEMIQVILNILKNAQDNFNEKGIDKPQIRITTREKSIAICDNGGGIPEEIMEKIFDPYFSTKDAKNGTGLGLYMSKTIVEEHHRGSLKASNQNGGVCFVIELGEMK